MEQDPATSDQPLGASREFDAETLQVLLAEYSMLQKSLDLAWALTQQRTGTFFALLSATAVSVGLVAQASGDRAALVPFTVIVLALASFVGVSTYVRVIQALREAMLSILSMNRIRHFLQEHAARAAASFTLPVNDDERSLHRGVGGMHGHGPEGLSLRYSLLQVHGVIAILSGGLAGLATAIAAAQLIPAGVALGLGAVVSLTLVGALLREWRRTVSDFRRSWEPLFPSTRNEPSN